MGITESAESPKQYNCIQFRYPRGNYKRNRKAHKCEEILVPRFTARRKRKTKELSEKHKLLAKKHLIAIKRDKSLKN